MPFSGAFYDPETMARLTRAFQDAWQKVRANYPERGESQLATTRKIMALRIMAAADLGERDIDTLRDLAIRAVEGRDFY